MKLNPRWLILLMLPLVGLLALWLGVLFGGTAQKARDPYRGTALDRPAPDFRLLDQRGKWVALSDFRGKVVVLTFMDSRCRDVCPLTALHLRLAYERLKYLGLEVSRLVLLGVNVNAEANALEDVRAFTAHYGLEGLPSWHFLTGSPQELQNVWKAYGVTVRTEEVAIEGGKLQSFNHEHTGPERASDHTHHTTGVYLIDPAGRQRWYISTLVGEEGELVTSWQGPALSDLLVEQLKPLLAATLPKGRR